MPDTDQFSDQQIIALTAWGENRGSGKQGMQSVINAIQNRLSSGVLWWGTSLRAICLRPFQFSSWNHNDPNRPKLLEVTTDDPQYCIALQLAAEALAGTLADIVGNADSYFSLSMPTPPKWAKNLIPTATIGGQVFFKTV